MKSIRAGITGDEKETRELVFGKNLIDIKEKTIPQLLVDEVRACSFTYQVLRLIYISGIPSILRLPDC